MLYLLGLLATALVYPRLAGAQQCYYPDGTAAIDVPCNSSAPVSSCCTSYGFCLTNGLCLDNGLLSRGSCTDKTWNSDACAQYCKNDNPSGGFNLMACSNKTWTCGFFPDNCGVSTSTFSIDGADGLILRSSQLTSLMEAAGIDKRVINNATNSSLPVGNDNKDYTAGELAGVGAGIGVPLLVVIAVLSYFLFRERRRVAEMNNDNLTSLRAPKPTEMAGRGQWAELQSPQKRDSGPGLAELSPETVQEMETPASASLPPDYKPATQI